MADNFSEDQLQQAIDKLRAQIEDPAQARIVLGAVSLGNLVMLSGLTDIVDNNELVAWLMMTADAIKENPKLRPEMKAAGEDLMAQINKELRARADEEA